MQKMSLQVIQDSARHLVENFQQRPKVHTGFALLGLAWSTKWLLTKTGELASLARIYLLPCKQRDWAREFGEWAVITGSTDGIGKEFARQLASQGLNIILISRNPEKLDKVAGELRRDFGVQTNTIVINFSQATIATYQSLEEELDNLHVNIGLLVNNVGVFVPGYTLMGQMGWDTLWDHVVVNCGATTMMTRTVLPQMKRRRRGAIINVSSAAGLAPSPLIGTYCASKVYMDYLSQSMRAEYEGVGVKVLNLNPFYVCTNMVQHDEAASKPSLFIPTAQQYVHSALRTFDRIESTSGYFPHTFQFALIRMLPKWWIRRAQRKLLETLHQAETKASESSKVQEN